MRWKKHKHILLAFTSAMMFSLFLLYLGTNGFLNINSQQNHPAEITLVANNLEEEVIIKPSTYVYEEKHYLLCDEREAKLVVDHNHLIGKTVAQLLQQDYLSSEGWQVDVLTDDTIVFYREINGFCSKHEDMRHLSVVDNHVAIMYGPSKAQGGVAKISNIMVSILPGQLRQQIEAGLIEFSSHEDALQALDTLDEYK